MQALVDKHAGKIIGSLVRLRSRSVSRIRMLASPRGMRSYLWHKDVRLTEFAAHVHDVSTRLKHAITQAVQDAARPVIHLQSSSERKRVLVREIARRDRSRGARSAC
jgi:hypothetical protein